MLACSRPCRYLQDHVLAASSPNESTGKDIYDTQPMLLEVRTEYLNQHTELGQETEDLRHSVDGRYTLKE